MNIICQNPYSILSDELDKEAKKIAEDYNKEMQQLQVCSFASRKVKVIKNVHREDIDCLIKIGSESFVSGSKDGSLKLWDVQGKLKRIVWKNAVIDNLHWITALAPLDDNSWLSGTRSGYVDLWNNSGDHIASLCPTPKAKPRKCKIENTNRINCIATQMIAGNSHYFIGWPTQFTLHSTRLKNRLTNCSTSNFDWVFNIHPLSLNKVLVVTGGEFNAWQREASDPSNGSWVKIKDFWLERKQSDSKERPYISHSLPLKDNSAHYALAIFNGAVAVLDIENGRKIGLYKEHNGRVWAVENISREVFASCSDDHTIKFWDERQAKSIMTLHDNIGRITNLILLGPHTLLSSSFPDNRAASPTFAEFTFWDLRKG